VPILSGLSVQFKERGSGTNDQTHLVTKVTVNRPDVGYHPIGVGINITEKGDALSVILKLGRPLRVALGGILCVQGKPARLLFYVRSGSVIYRVSSMTGREAVFMKLATGQLFPLTSLRDRTNTYKANAIANEDCELVAIEISKLRKLMSSDLRVSNYFLQISAERITYLLDQFVDTALLPSSSRVAKWLFDLAREQGTKLHDGMVIPLQLSTRRIGLSLAGMARETVSRQLRVLVREGIIGRSNKTITILDIARLQTHSEGAATIG
jgi:CRP/FNR family cyclic AMP-dependent transcriptional regulator